MATDLTISVRVPFLLSVFFARGKSASNCGFTVSVLAVRRAEEDARV
jgi:hypothetical protein